MKWKAVFDVWPYSHATVASAEEVFNFDADRIDDALKTANLIRKGIETNKDVWQCILRELVGKHT